ncbi:MAG TPA: hypothetical protein DEP35_24435 [Deltaproteobacteria bacterium]|nr:hypothetical protein [Deltaproteobacteria bacterium]
MKTPETKGILLVTVVADVVRLMKEDRISRDDLEEEVCADALKLIDEGVSPVSWYPSVVYRDLVRILMKLEGKGLGDMEYVRKRGERAGQRLLESGLYQQLDFLTRRIQAQESSSRESFEQALRLIVSMAASLTNGGSWTVCQDPEYPDRVQILGTGVDGLSEENAQGTCGMFTGISLHGGAGFAWRYERQGPDRIVYRMDRDIRDLRFKSSNSER